MSREQANSPRIGTLALHAGQTPDPTTTARAVPIYATTSYVFHDTEHAANLFGLREFGNIYTRLMNPTTDVLEKRLTALDGGAAGLAFASGQAAITASLLTIAHSGQNFISANSLYGGTWTLFTQAFSKLGVEVRFFDPSKPETLSKLVDKNTRAVYIETPGNPKNDVPDYKKITDIAHGHGLPAIIDNTALTAALFRPIEHGFDIVVYSTTKFIGGHGVHIGGAIVDSGKFPWAKEPAKWPEFTRARPGLPWFDLRGGPAAHRQHRLRHPHPHALASRYGFHAESLRLVPDAVGVGDVALTVGAALEKCPGRRAVPGEASGRAVGELSRPARPPRLRPAQRYLPDGQGAIVGFGIKGGKEAGAKLINSVKLFSHLANIGDAKSLIIHPATTTHSQLTPEDQAQTGVTPEYVRLSVGIEDLRDIVADLDQALKASQS